MHSYHKSVCQFGVGFKEWDIRVIGQAAGVFFFDLAIPKPQPCESCSNWIAFGAKLGIPADGCESDAC